MYMVQVLYALMLKLSSCEPSEPITANVYLSVVFLQLHVNRFKCILPHSGLFASFSNIFHRTVLDH